METHRSYAQQAHDYYREQRWHQRLLAARVPRSLAIRAGTLAALGGASVLSQILAACAGSGAQKETAIGISAEGAYKYSKFPMIEKYNWRNLPWGGTPYVDGSLVMTGSGASNWDFVRRSGLTSYGQIMDNLLNKRYGAGADMQKDELEAHLADRWSHAPDYSYSDYHIRRETYFHDIEPVNGRLCTAEDVRYCLEVYRKDSLARAPLEIIDRIEVLPDKETVRVHLKRPALVLDMILSGNNYYIFAREHFEGPKERWERQPIGIGPFKMVNQRVGTGGTMETVRHERFARRDDRWAGYQLPFLKEFKQISLAAEVTTKAALRSGQIDFSSISDYVDLQDLISTNPEFIVQVQAPNTTYSTSWTLNLRDPLFQDIRVRRALSLALNRREMIETLLGGMGSGAHAITWTWLGLSDPLTPADLGQWQQYDPAKAKALLAEAGYPNGFELEDMVSGSPSNSDIMVQQYLEQVGVRVKFNQVEGVVATSAFENKSFKHSITRLSGTGSTGYDPIKWAREWFLPGSPKNYGSINDPVMTDLVDRATYTLDADEQRRLLWKIHERELDQSYRLETYVPFSAFVRQPWLGNVASAVQGYFNAWGYHQVTTAWINDKAPAGRGGRLKA